MAKLVLPSSLLVLVLFTSGMQICTVAGETCHNDIGSCILQDSPCDVRCNDKYPGENTAGDCATSPGMPQVCTCYYDCAAANATSAPPKPKRCTTGSGLCSYKNCGESCCNARCGARYEDGHAHGYCYELEQYNSCLCEFDCGAKETLPTRNSTSNSVNVNANWILPIIPVLGSYFLY